MGKGLSSKVFKKGDLVSSLRPSSILDSGQKLGIVMSQDGILVEVYWITSRDVVTRLMGRDGRAYVPAYELKRIEDEV